MELTGSDAAGEASADFHAHAAEAVTDRESPPPRENAIQVYLREVAKPYTEAWSALTQELDSRDAAGVARAVREVALRCERAWDTARLREWPASHAALLEPQARALALAIVKAIDGEFGETDAATLLALIADGDAGKAVALLRWPARPVKPNPIEEVLANPKLASLAVSLKTPTASKMVELAARLGQSADKSASLTRSVQLWPAGTNPAIERVTEAGQAAERLQVASQAFRKLQETRLPSKAETTARLLETLRPCGMAEWESHSGIQRAAEEAMRLVEASKPRPDLFRDGLLHRAAEQAEMERRLAVSMQPRVSYPRAEVDHTYTEAVRYQMDRRAPDDPVVAELRQQIAALEAKLAESQRSKETDDAPDVAEARKTTPPTPAVKGKDINGKMLSALSKAADDPAKLAELLDRKQRQWAKCLSCSPGTVGGTAAWIRITEMRATQQAARVNGK